VRRPARACGGRGTSRQGQGKRTRSARGLEATPLSARASEVQALPPTFSNAAIGIASAPALAAVLRARPAGARVPLPRAQGWLISIVAARSRDRLAPGALWRAKIALRKRSSVSPPRGGRFAGGALHPLQAEAFWISRAAHSAAAFEANGRTASYRRFRLKSFCPTSWARGCRRQRQRLAQL